MEYDDKDQGKNNIPQVQTFTVPFALGETKENISISSNNRSKPSKEQIINQAIKFQLKGNISEAAKYYQYFINKGFKDHRVFSNYGVILKDLGKLKEAELSYRKAIEIKPDYANAHYNLGNILRDLGQLKEAEISLRKAIEIKPDYAVAHSNLGNVLRDLGKSKEAGLSLRKAIELNPDLAEAYSNLGNVLRDLEKLKEAELSTRKAIEIKPDYAVAHYNLGTILIDLDKLKEAELSLRKAIELNPDLAEAYSNLGNVLRDLGKLKEAELSTRKAIEIKPDYAEAHSNLGGILSNLGKLKEAEISSRKAIEIKPDYGVAYSNLGTILKDIGKSQEAFDSYLKALDINPTDYDIYTSISIFLRDADISQLDKLKIKEILNIMLERNDVSHQELFKPFNFLYSNEITINLAKLDSDSASDLFLNDKLIINALKKIVFKDPNWERLLIKLRKDICNRIANRKGEVTNWQLELFIALAEQCFSNEYIYSIELEETQSLEKIIKICNESKLNETNLSVLACYLPLYKLIDQIPSIKDFKSTKNNLNALLKVQLVEPLEEIKISKEITKIGSITNHISQKVRSQYEENPYPRWRFYASSKASKSSAIVIINNDIKPNSITSNLESNPLKILIAGCGTGMQILEAQKYRNAQITAIDISCSSLSFAQRKINEIGIKNVNLFQMDILEVALLQEQFDIIECCGVLHHMADPQQGLKALLDIFNPNGFMKLSLYSELSRQTVVKTREYIKAKNMNASIDNMRNLRKDILSGKCPELYSLTSPDSDFYNTSNFRDLCFHYQEHRFTFKQLEDTLITHKLKFLGFCRQFLNLQTRSLYKQYFPEDKIQANLNNWGELERKHPGIFGATPHFWVCKGE
ncbi:Hypothetical protein NATL1_19711 [Prochlorococcus marinus str. NATL1A]|uniref:Methyltransferase domain-containing protein n=1 Tax=Prochlorococcus marinus (strain NATL1A) TaxID=167555 RepID=A2C4W7_PROM1|nr:class I SAM-dependent methyltransferase [Prochlorococcus marinus]ABM76527.1 Hypothetical protein NATL1_19711 [Prochlorococcus marinus str. NATL1A]